MGVKVVTYSQAPVDMVSWFAWQRAAENMREEAALAYDSGPRRTEVSLHCSHISLPLQQSDGVDFFEIILALTEHSSNWQFLLFSYSI